MNVETATTGAFRLEGRDARDVSNAGLDVDLIAATIAIISTAAASILRLGVESATREPLSILGVSLAIVLGPRALRWLHGKLHRWRGTGQMRQPSGSRWLESGSISLLIVLVGVVALGWISRLIGVSLWPIVAVGGYASLALLIADSGPSQRHRRIGLIVGAAALTTFMIGMVWQDDYNVLSHVNMMLGVDQPDTLYYASIVSMIDTYGISSTGLDGAIFVPTHFGSHALFAQLASLLNVDALTILELGFPIVFLPLLVKALLSLASEVAAIRGESPSVGSLWTWMVLIPAFVGLPKTAAVRLQSPDELVLVSEPHGVGVAAGLLVMAVVVTLWRTRMRDRARASAGDVLAWAVGIPALVGAVAFVRLPIGAVLLAVCGYLTLRLGAYRRWFIFVGAALGVVAVGAVALMMMRVVGVSPSSDHVGASLGPVWWLVWLLTTLFWPIVYCTIRLARLKPISTGELWRQVREGRLLDIEAVAVAAAVGLVAVLGFSAPGTSMEAFVDLQRWIAVTLLVSMAAPAYLLALQRPLRWSSRRAIPAFATMVVLVLASGPNFVRPIIGTLKANLVTRHSVAQRITYTRGELQRAGNWRADDSALGRGRALVDELREPAQPALEQQPRYALIRALSALRDLPASQRRHAAVFIPRTNRAYWDWLRLCLSTPFAAPALSGMAALYNLPETGCNYRALGYSAYDMTDRHDLAPVNDADVCRHAVMEGASRVAVIDAPSSTTVTTRWLTCGRGPSALP